MYYGLINSMNRAVVSSYTARTTAFASATAITDTTILNALNTFDLGLISNSLATKMKAVYPFVGSTATTQKFNFMDARDLDIAYRLQFNGGWVHSANGALGNGTNTFMNTFLIPTVYSNFNTSGFGIYSRTDESGDFDEGSGGFGGSPVNMIYPRIADGRADYYVGGKETLSLVSNSLGLIVGSQISSTDRRLYKNGIKIATTTGGLPSTIVPFYNMYFGANSSGSTYIQNPSNKSYAFAFHCENMTDTDQTNLYTLTQNLQIALSRQV